MSKLTARLLGTTLALAISASAGATTLGPEAAACEGQGPALLVHVEGLKTRTGSLRVQSYGGDPARYFNKGAYQRRVDVLVPASGPVEICVPVSSNGTYAISVRHDLDNSGKTSSKDGGGMSGNPRMSLMDVIFKRKPDPKLVQVPVRGVTKVRVVLNYVQGGSFGPIAMASR